MSKQRLSDYVRVTEHSDGIRLASRTGTGRSDHFGDAQSMNLTKDEAIELMVFLNSRYPLKDE